MQRPSEVKGNCGFTIMDEGTRDYFQEKFKNLASQISDLKDAEIRCQQEVFDRLRTVELQVVGNMAGTWRGAFIIGFCSLLGASLAHVIGRFF